MTQTSTTDTTQQLNQAKDRLKQALLRLDGLIDKQNSSLTEANRIRSKVLEDLDNHIDNLKTILDKRS